MTRALAFALVLAFPLALPAQISSIHPALGPARDAVTFDYDFSTDRLDIDLRISRDGHTGPDSFHWSNVRRYPAPDDKPDLNWDIFDGIRQPEPTR